MRVLHRPPVTFHLPVTSTTVRSYSVDRKTSEPSTISSDKLTEDSNASRPEPGPLARRLEEATEEALFTGGRAGRQAIEDAGFSEDLKQRLLDKVADANFREEHGTALREAGLIGNVPEAAGQGTRDLATAQPWTGQEADTDVVLRMLDDANKRLRPGLRGKPNIPSPSGIPVDMRLRRKPVITPGAKAANAKDAASVYADMAGKEKSVGLSDKEREAFRKELRDRFAPAARAVPSTISGLAALANERIEDAIARGQFKNIPRGKGIERDARADNPFIDTTEYIMNKMIQRQDIVPPWIEKQQELVKTANNFRARLRNDWKRHASRMISSRGGSLEEQMRRAEEYARAEEVHNPRRRNSDQVAVPTNTTDDIVMVAMRQEALPESPANVPGASLEATSEPEISLTSPFRDVEWEATERSYMELAVNDLNSKTRAYNLMAPDLAKKPYFSLDRELKACFADVAPLIANEIKERARRPPKSLVGEARPSTPGLLDKFIMEGKSSKVYESKSPHYGFKEFWKDLWQRSS
ncbi:hypothetical protein VM1G_03067 [Cytospora mali]|uniref:DnaJ homologue subfamily C member 28 conserved domain-containing protein n=1 Tax=Cytospora mali TaxID=578113 RepID=A0A194VTD3_CYTMA|nr:hypothetical protein VM1G_03067 [Valsa mali]